MLYLYMLVQSGSYPADLLLERTEAFIPQFISEFKRLLPETFEKYRGAVIQAKLQRDRASPDTARRLFYTAFRNDANWDYLSEEIRAVGALTQDEVNGVLTQVLANKQSRRLVIRLTGKGHSAEAAEGPDDHAAVSVAGGGLDLRFPLPVAGNDAHSGGRGEVGAESPHVPVE